MLLNSFDNHALGKIISIAARVKDIEMNVVLRCLKDALDDISKILYVAIRAPCIWIVYQQVPLQKHLPGELADG